VDNILEHEYMPALPNLLNIKFQTELNKKITILSLIRMIELSASIITKFDFGALKEIHNYIYQDALRPEEIDENTVVSVENIIQKLNNFDWKHKSITEKAMQLSNFLFDITNLKPFIQGTFQAAMLYLSKLLKHHGLAIDLEYLYSHSTLISKYLFLDDAFIRERVAMIIQGSMELALARENTYEKVAAAIEVSGYRPTDTLINNIRKLNERLCIFHTIIEIYDLYKYPELLGHEEKKLVSLIADGFRIQETQYFKPLCKTKNPEYPDFYKQF
jgi:fido (protein-threonine AMPylation protein)